MASNVDGKCARFHEERGSGSSEALQQLCAASKALATGAMPQTVQAVQMSLQSQPPSSLQRRRPAITALHLPSSSGGKPITLRLPAGGGGGGDSGRGTAELSHSGPSSSSSATSRGLSTFEADDDDQIRQMLSDRPLDHSLIDASKAPVEVSGGNSGGGPLRVGNMVFDAHHSRWVPVSSQSTKSTAGAAHHCETDSGSAAGDTTNPAAEEDEAMADFDAIISGAGSPVSVSAGGSSTGEPADDGGSTLRHLSARGFEPTAGAAYTGASSITPADRSHGGASTAGSSARQGIRFTPASAASGRTTAAQYLDEGRAHGGSISPPLPMLPASSRQRPSGTATAVHVDDGEEDNEEGDFSLTSQTASKAGAACPPPAAPAPGNSSGIRDVHGFEAEEEEEEDTPFASRASSELAPGGGVPLRRSLIERLGGSGPMVQTAGGSGTSTATAAVGSFSSPPSHRPAGSAAGSGLTSVWSPPPSAVAGIIAQQSGPRFGFGFEARHEQTDAAGFATADADVSLCFSDDYRPPPVPSSRRASAPPSDNLLPKRPFASAEPVPASLLAHTPPGPDVGVHLFTSRKHYTPSGGSSALHPSSARQRLGQQRHTGWSDIIEEEQDDQDGMARLRSQRLIGRQGGAPRVAPLGPSGGSGRMRTITLHDMQRMSARPQQQQGSKRVRTTPSGGDVTDDGDDDDPVRHSIARAAKLVQPAAGKQHSIAAAATSDDDWDDDNGDDARDDAACASLPVPSIGRPSRPPPVPPLWGGPSTAASAHGSAQPAPSSSRSPAAPASVNSSGPFVLPIDLVDRLRRHQQHANDVMAPWDPYLAGWAAGAGPLPLSLPLSRELVPLMEIELSSDSPPPSSLHHHRSASGSLGSAGGVGVGGGGEIGSSGSLIEAAEKMPPHNHKLHQPLSTGSTTPPPAGGLTIDGGRTSSGAGGGALVSGDVSIGVTALVSPVHLQPSPGDSSNSQQQREQSVQSANEGRGTPTAHLRSARDREKDRARLLSPPSDSDCYAAGVVRCGASSTSDDVAAMRSIIMHTALPSTEYTMQRGDVSCRNTASSFGRSSSSGGGGAAGPALPARHHGHHDSAFPFHHATVSTLPQRFPHRTGSVPPTPSPHTGSRDASIELRSPGGVIMTPMASVVIPRPHTSHKRVTAAAGSAGRGSITPSPLPRHHGQHQHQQHHNTSGAGPAVPVAGGRARKLTILTRTPVAGILSRHQSPLRTAPAAVTSSHGTASAHANDARAASAAAARAKGYATISTSNRPTREL